jgi:NAD(P)-dependent dehydrogenase (short-subunit alcohol dehydrogenase family)
VANGAGGRVVVVTGAAQGLGRAHALALAVAGNRVVVNDVASEAAAAVAEEIVAAGGTAVAAAGDVADWDGSAAVVEAALASFGRLDGLVNNAGIVRDRMVVNMSEAEWDEVMRVDLKGHFCPLRHAAAHWRERSRAGERNEARVVNTTSGAGLMGSVGQANYAAAKAGVAALTEVAAVELARYGITVNAIAPAARTPMTEQVFAEAMRRPPSGFDTMDPANVSPLVVYLVSAGAGGVTGRVFEVEGGVISVADGWQHGPRLEKERRWEVEEIGPALEVLIRGAPAPAPVYGS